MSRCTGVVLAGGQALRFGGVPKGLERVGGKRIIDRVADALRATTDELLVIANDPGASAWLPEVRTAPDVQVGAGSLGGIHAALVHAGSAVLVVAWDMPFVPPSLLSALRTLGREADAVVPESDSRRGLEPLCAYYSPACLGPVERRIASGDRRVIAFHQDVRLVRLTAAEVAQHGDPAVMFMNVNTPDDLSHAERHGPTTDGGRHRQEE